MHQGVVGILLIRAELGSNLAGGGGRGREGTLCSSQKLQEYIGKEVVIGIRPECIHDEPIYLEKFSDSIIDAYVEFTELMGAEIYLYLKIGEETNVISRVSSRSQAKPGDTIKVAIDTTHVHFFDKDTERVITH